MGQSGDRVWKNHKLTAVRHGVNNSESSVVEQAFGIYRFSCFWQSYEKVSPIAIYYRNFLTVFNLLINFYTDQTLFLSTSVPGLKLGCVWGGGGGGDGGLKKFDRSLKAPPLVYPGYKSITFDQKPFSVLLLLLLLWCFRWFPRIDTYPFLGRLIC